MFVCSASCLAWCVVAWRSSIFASSCPSTAQILALARPRRPRLLWRRPESALGDLEGWQRAHRQLAPRVTWAAKPAGDRRLAITTYGMPHTGWHSPRVHIA